MATHEDETQEIIIESSSTERVDVGDGELFSGGQVLPDFGILARLGFMSAYGVDSSVLRYSHEPGTRVSGTPDLDHSSSATTMRHGPSLLPGRSRRHTATTKR